MWVYSPKATKTQQTAITTQFEPVIATLKKNLKPIPEPQKYNHCIDIFSKWRGNFFYIMLKFKTGENGMTDFFDHGVTRFEFCGENRFNAWYFRHTGKWEPLSMYKDISLEEAKELILKDPTFQFF